MKAMIRLGCVFLFALAKKLIENIGADLGAVPTVLLILGTLLLANVVNMTLQGETDEKREAKARK